MDLIDHKLEDLLRSRSGASCALAVCCSSESPFGSDSETNVFRDTG